jgi:Tol biopolymer transport system component
MASPNQPASLTQSSVLSPQSFTSLDRAVLLVIVVLLVLIGGTILLGDRVGVQLSQVAPLGDAHSTTAISMRFSEAMDHASASAHFRIEPALQGDFRWSGATMTFQPSEALLPGSTYTVSMQPGALSETGRTVLTEVRYSFTVSRPRVAYLYPADDLPNLWLVDPADPDNPRQITDSPTGIDDFGVSPDGTRIAFSENNPVLQTTDIKLIDLETGALQQLTNCVKALCSAPVWRPDGRMIAYQRIEIDDQFGNSPPRIWLLDLTTVPATTQPLFQQSQMLGYDAQWSADGNRIALVDRGSSSIVIYDFSTGKIAQVGSTAGTSGALSPDGTQLIYPDLKPDVGGMLNKLRLFNVDSGDFAAISDDNEPVDDQRAQWRPDGAQIAIARREPSARGIQVVLLDMATGNITPLTTEPRYSNLLFWYDPTGTEMLMQRFPELDANMQTNPNGRPEIWTFNLVSGEQQMVARNGFLPRWVP